MRARPPGTEECNRSGREVSPHPAAYARNDFKHRWSSHEARVHIMVQHFERGPDCVAGAQRDAFAKLRGNRMYLVDLECGHQFVEGG